MKQPPPNNIEHLRKQRGLTQKGLARLLGISFQAVQKDEKGARKLTIEKATAYANALNVNMDEIIENKKSAKSDTKQPRIESTKLPFLGNPAPLYSAEKAPLYRVIKGENGMEAIDYNNPVDWKTKPVGLEGIANLFALEIRDISMHPRYKLGETIFVAKDRQPQPSEDCVIETADGLILVREFINQDDKKAYFLQHKPEKTTEYLLPKLKAIHAIKGRL